MEECKIDNIIGSLSINEYVGKNSEIYIATASANVHEFQIIEIFKYSPIEKSFKTLSSANTLLPPTKILWASHLDLASNGFLLTTSDSLRVYRWGIPKCILHHDRNALHSLDVGASVARNPGAQSSLSTSIISADWSKLHKEKIISCGTDGKVILWDLFKPHDTFSEVACIYSNGKMQVCDCSFGKVENGNLVALSLMNKQIIIHDIRLKTIRMRENAYDQFAITTVSWSRNTESNHILQCDLLDGSLKMYDLRKLETLEYEYKFTVAGYGRSACAGIFNTLLKDSFAVARHSGVVEIWDYSKNYEAVLNKVYDLNSAESEASVFRRITAFSLCPATYTGFGNKECEIAALAMLEEKKFHDECNIVNSYNTICINPSLQIIRVN